jgi:hypothetical protein
LELFLGRDTFEGIFRYQNGIKAPKELKIFQEKRIKMRLNEEGPWKGAIMVFIPSTDKLRIEPISQFGLKLNAGKWGFFSPKRIPTKDQAVKQGFKEGEKENIRFLFRDDNELLNLHRKLLDLGFDVKPEIKELRNSKYTSKL